MSLIRWAQAKKDRSIQEEILAQLKAIRELLENASIIRDEEG